MLRCELTPIGEVRTEQLDIVPAPLRVRVTRRPRYACRTCDDVVVIAPAPDRPIDGGMETEALVAHVVVSKFADAQPLCRCRSFRGKASCSTAPRWPIGSAAPAGGCSRSTTCWSARGCHP